MVGLVQPKLVSWILEKSALQYYRITFFIISINTYWLYVINIHLYTFPDPKAEAEGGIWYPCFLHCTPLSNKNHTWDNTASSRDQWQFGDPDVTESHSTVGNIVLEPQVFQETELDDGNFPKPSPEWEARKRKQFSVAWRTLSFKQRGKTKGELRVLTLVALIYLHMCSQHVNCTTYRDPPGCLVQDLWRGEILWGWPTCPTKCERDSPKGSGISAEGFLELSREKRRYPHWIPTILW